VEDWDFVPRFVAPRDEGGVRNPLVDEILKDVGYQFEPLYDYCSNDIEAAYMKLDQIMAPQYSNIDMEALTKADLWTEAHFYEALKMSRVAEDCEVFATFNRKASAGIECTAQGWSTKGECEDNMGSFLMLVRSFAKNPCYWSAITKEEIRPKRKIAEKKLRLFTSAPADHHFVGQRYSLVMNEAFCQLYGRSFSAVGMSKFHGGWNYVMSRVLQHEYRDSLDHSGFDIHILEILLRMQENLRHKYLTFVDVQESEFRKFYDDVIHTRIVMPDGYVFVTEKFLPSGYCNTSVDGTMINFRLFAYCWIKLIGTCYEDFIACVAAALYGDDNNFTTSEPLFNGDSISRVLLQDFGMTVRVEEEDMKDVFLSQRTVNKWGKMYPYPELNKSMSSLLMSPAGPDPIMNTWTRMCAIRTDTHFTPQSEIFDVLCQEYQKRHPEVNPRDYKNLMERDLLYRMD
jgi:hypothetical protein